MSKPEIANSISAAGIQTNYHDMGQGKPVLFIHGSTMLEIVATFSARANEFQAQVLAKAKAQPAPANLPVPLPQPREELQDPLSVAANRVSIATVELS